jgi:hypothetical protein
MRRLLIVTVLLFGVCSSTTIEPRSVEELTHDSSDIIIGTASTPRSVWNAAHTMIYTVTNVRIEQALKGERSGWIPVTQMGGRLDGIQTKVAGVRQFQAGERAALFLRPSSDMPGTFVITGLMQGRFTVTTSSSGKPMVSNGVAGVTSYDRTTGELREFSGAPMTLDQLESRVKRAVSR